MKRFVIAIVMLMTAASAAGAQTADGKSAADAVTGFFKKMDAGYSYSRYFIDSKPASIGYDLAMQRIYVGNPRGTRFMFEKGTTDFEKTTGKIFSTTNTMETTGIVLSARLGRLKGHSASVGFAEKEIATDPFTTYVYSGAALVPDMKITTTRVESSPFMLEYAYDCPTGPWSGSLGYSSERLRMVNDPTPPVAAKSWKLRAQYDWKQLSSELGWTKMKNNRGVHGNTNLELTVSYKSKKHLTGYIKVGAYNQGLPVSGNGFAGLGGQYVFDYIVGDPSYASYTRLYSEKFGYYAVGITVSLQ